MSPRHFKPIRTRRAGPRRPGIWKIVTVLLAGLLVGGGAALLGTAPGGYLTLVGTSEAGGWYLRPLAGSPEADPLTRAQTAQTALLAPAAAETIRAWRTHDDDGARLEEACRYELTIPSPVPARWWSVTLYDETLLLARNQDGAASIDAARAVRDQDGTIRVAIEPGRATAANRLSSRNAGRFTLALRLYNPIAAATTAPETLAWPRLARRDCP